MFENVGSKVKALAMAVCVLGIIGSIIGAIIIWASGLRGAFLRGLLTLALGCFGSWLGTLVTYAIGQAAESAETNEGRIKTLQDKIDQLQQSLKNSGGNAAGNTPAAPPIAPRTGGRSDLHAAATKNEKWWTCKKCGHTNKSSQLYCEECGTYK